MSASEAARRLGVLTIATALLALAAIAATLAASATDASAAAKRGECDISGEQRDFNTSYVGYIKERGTDCGTAKDVTRSFHKCRHRRGGANGHCTREVQGWKCDEDRYNKSPYQYNSRVACKKGSAVIKSQYTQNT